MLEVLTLCLFKRMLCCVGSQGHEFLSGSAVPSVCVFLVRWYLLSTYFGVKVNCFSCLFF